jgi:Spy/CpxP family protein refolding chaperone
MKKNADVKAFNRMFDLTKFTKHQAAQMFSAFKKARLCQRLGNNDPDKIERWRSVIYKGVKS